ncbi:MAG: hypothetical protein JNK48_29740 [Bryobacterales bacterium]|nr:hypothetical protein [Bryobacterales bacterium]
MRILLLVFTLLLANGATGFAQNPVPETPKMVKYYLGLLKKGPQWDSTSAKASEIQKHHLAHLRHMHELGKLTVAGPFGDNGEIRGILIFRGKDPIDDIRKLAEADPAVQSGRMMLELHPWYVQDGILP